jgi:ribulose bisphosphate carboxylase small subunit
MLFPIRTAIRYSLVILPLAVTGCSVVQSFTNAKDAREEIAKAEKSVAEGDYNAGLESYLRARLMLQSARNAGFKTLADDRKMESLDAMIQSLQEKADGAGLVFVDGSYCNEEEMGKALGKSLGVLFNGNQIRSIAVERVVAGDVEASSRRRSDNTWDVTLSVVLKEGGEEADFSQDAWAIVRFLLEGGYAHGFSYHVKHPFDKRPWMGGEAGWGMFDRRDATNHFNGLKSKIADFSIRLFKGSHSPGAEKQYSRFGFESLEAVGPYWKKTPFKTYTIRAADAARLNWADAKQIPDATIYSLLEIDEQMDEENEPRPEGSPLGN